MFSAYRKPCCKSTDADRNHACGRALRIAVKDDQEIPVTEFEHAAGQTTMIAFLRRLSMHYGIYRRYPLARFSALRNAWRIARA